eukprot:2570402-Amphidinium_carterae.1
MAVHGKSGTWAFDSGGRCAVLACAWLLPVQQVNVRSSSEVCLRHAYEYVYEVPQGGYAPSDYYLCDSREHPQHCGLLGGMRLLLGTDVLPLPCATCWSARQFGSRLC